MTAVTAGGRRRSVASLALGSVGAGVLAYVFFVVATRALGAEEAASVSVLWTWWGFTAAAITFPLQHWIARTVEAREIVAYSVTDGYADARARLGLDKT